MEDDSEDLEDDLLREVLEEFVDAARWTEPEAASRAGWIEWCMAEKHFAPGRSNRVRKKQGRTVCKECGEPVKQKPGRGAMKLLCDSCFLKKRGR